MKLPVTLSKIVMRTGALHLFIVDANKTHHTRIGIYLILVSLPTDSTNPYYYHDCAC